MVALSTNMIKFYDIQNAPKRKEEKNHILDSNSIKEDDRHIFSLISQPVGWFFIKSVQLHKLLLQTFFFLIFFLLYKKTSYRVRILTMQKQLESARKYFFQSRIRSPSYSEEKNAQPKLRKTLLPSKAMEAAGMQNRCSTAAAANLAPIACFCCH